MISKSIAYRIIVGAGLIVLMIIWVVWMETSRKLSRGENVQIPNVQNDDLLLLPFLGAFLVCVLLASAFIDYIRVETKWHFILKWLAYISIFLVAFVVFVTFVAFFDAYRMSL